MQCFFTALLLCAVIIPAGAQTDTLMNVTVEAKDSVTGKDLRPVKNTFEGMWVIDNQSVMVPVKGSFEFVIQHRFGTVENGYDDLWGLYAPSNIRLGFSYTPANKLMVGFGFTKENITWDFNAKYAIFKQARKGGSPVSLTLFGNAAIDTRDAENFVNSSDRYSYFGQLILARKVSDNFSIQVAPSISHFNAVPSYVDEDDNILPAMENDHFAISVAGRYKVSSHMSLLADYDQPITQHYTNNPNPNLSFGIEIGTSSHTFQIFFTNYKSIVPQRNNVFNSNDYKNGQYLVGFNITHVWN